MLGVMLLSGIFPNKLSYPRARRAIPWSINLASNDLNRDIPWMSRFSRLANQTALDQLLTAAWEQSLLVSVGMIYIDKLEISRWCVLKLHDGGHYMITSRQKGVRYTSLSKMWHSQHVYIIYLSTETGN